MEPNTQKKDYTADAGWWSCMSKMMSSSDNCNIQLMSGNKKIVWTSRIWQQKGLTIYWNPDFWCWWIHCIDCNIDTRTGSHPYSANYLINCCVHPMQIFNHMASAFLRKSDFATHTPFIHSHTFFRMVKKRKRNVAIQK